MRIDFRQGIVTYPSSGGIQSFLIRTGNNVSMTASLGRVDVAFAHKDTDYLFTETADVNSAWVNVPSDVTVWLFWNLDKLSGVRTFGFTTVEPLYSPTPVPAVNDQHWFDTTTNTMKCYISNGWREVIRVFAAKISGSQFLPLGVGVPSHPFAGSQVGVHHIDTAAGHLLADATGRPIRRANGTFFTTESDFFINGSPVNPIRIDATIVSAAAAEPIAKFNVVKFSEFGKVITADYIDVTNTIVALAMEDVDGSEVGQVCLHGKVDNPQWNWSSVGAALWVSNGGTLVEYDTHLIDPIGNPQPSWPVARVLTSTSIVFNPPSIGSIGADGTAGPPGPRGADGATGPIGPIGPSGDSSGTGGVYFAPPYTEEVIVPPPPFEH